MTTNTKRIGDINDVARLLGVSTRTIRRMVRDGELAATQVRRRCLRFDLDAVDVYLQSRTLGG